MFEAKQLLTIFLLGGTLQLCVQAQENHPPCQKAAAPKLVLSEDAEPPRSWYGHGPKKATTALQITIDKKGRVQDPTVVHSGGEDVDKKVPEAVRNWKFKPAKCDDQPVETKINIDLTVSMR